MVYCALNGVALVTFSIFQEMIQEGFKYLSLVQDRVTKIQKNNKHPHQIKQQLEHFSLPPSS